MKISSHLFQLYPYPSQYATQTPTQSKYMEVSRRFSARFGLQPTFFSKAAAKVRLFGSNSRYYNGQHVFVCLQKDVIVAISSNTQQEIVVHNQMETLYPDLRLELNQKDSKYIEGNQYLNLVLAGIKAALSHSPLPAGANLFISSDFNKGKGLGYSSALMTSVALSLCTLFKLKTAGLVQRLEEQARNITGSQQKFNFQIYFTAQNLSLTTIKKILNWPKTFTLIYFDSLKAKPSLNDAAGKRKNLQQCQRLLALELIARKIGYESAPWKCIQSMRQQLQCTYEQLILQVDNSLDAKGYRKAELEAELDEQFSKIVHSIPYANTLFDEHITFKPAQRIKLLIAEAIVAEAVTDQKVPPHQAMTCYSKIVADCAEPPPVLPSLPCKQIGTGYYIFTEETARKDSVMKEVEQIYFYQRRDELYIDDMVERMLFASLPSKGSGALDPEHEIWF